MLRLEEMMHSYREGVLGRERTLVRVLGAGNWWCVSQGEGR